MIYFLSQKKYKSLLKYIANAEIYYIAGVGGGVYARDSKLTLREENQ
jgi:hypothetical protein